jgi:putative Mn2+ efflux pump MntP
MQSIVLCSIDSFLAALGIGLLERSESRKRTIIIAFAACDLISTLAGLTLRSTLAPSAASGLVLAPLLLIVAAAAVLAHSQKLPVVFLAIPILLGLDNFLAGLFDGSLHAFQSPWIAAIASGLLATAGFAIARVVRPQFSRPWAYLAGGSLMILAFLSFN